jgi:signal transduction histidine kinase
MVHRLRNSIQPINNAKFYMRKEMFVQAYEEFALGSKQLLDTFKNFSQLLSGEDIERFISNNFPELLSTLCRPYGVMSVQMQLEVNTRALFINDRYKRYADIILWNLINNAWKYSSHRILKHDMPYYQGNTSVLVMAVCNDDFLTVRICDKGDQIPPQQWQRMLTGKGEANSDPAIFSSGRGYIEIMAAFEQIGGGSISLHEAEPPFTKAIEVRLPMSIFSVSDS